LVNGDKNHIPFPGCESYNIFEKVNMTPIQQISAVFEALSAPARLQILLGIGAGEACVCHLEALLGLRQAYISQHLMALRDKDLITARREGKYIYYRLRDPGILNLVSEAARLAGLTDADLRLGTLSHCECPHCNLVRIDVQNIEIR
jgi:ArsR family transcriptional regulator